MTRQIDNVLSLLSMVEPKLDGDTLVFPGWKSRIMDILSIQGVLDIVDGSLPRPSDIKATRSIYSKGPDFENYGPDWDRASDKARSTIKLTLSLDLARRYQNVKPASKLFKSICDAYDRVNRARRVQVQDHFWLARHNPNRPIAMWISRIKIAAEDLSGVKCAVSDRIVTDRLVR